MSPNHQKVAGAIDIKRKRSRRSKFEMLISVLQIIANGKQRPIPIMYASNLSYNPLQEILTFLVDRGLIVREEKRGSRRKLYFITEKGLGVLSHYNAIKRSFMKRGE